MRFNAAVLEIMLEKGLTLAQVVEIAWAAEGGRPADPPSKNERAAKATRRFNSNDKRRIYDILAERDGELCAECGCDAITIWRRQGVWVNEEECRYTKVHPTSNLEIDHRTPLWAGGDNDLENLWLLCVECHKAKTASEASQRRRA